jgi:hypothetical protein
MARKNTFLEAGGFDENMYPNEENALMDDMVRKGGVLMYDPGFTVSRLPRSSMRAFSRMLFNYGRGRADQMRRHPSVGSLLNLFPAAFLIYCAGLPSLIIAGCFQFWAALPLFIYGILAGTYATTQPAMPGASRVRIFCMIALTHLLYGAGILWGLTRKPSRLREAGSVPVKLETITTS